ncbi:hypothetical protein SAMN05428982_0521 [Pseudoxanthomonas sp. CF385]|uniref:ORC-CDC6 family AAA ATPase n=1 Tax=Pseudoxanthomonas sp. CF385 TaxID=1881042 RepID=UPI00087F17C9|nr:hypothetical protein [Pseudoxanthomonas sp. CF385]SDQ29826.1 hypothetical protein SAMN05428982_0521 [Pseudoxanthomonas sp. CF385]
MAEPNLLVIDQQLADAFSNFRAEHNGAELFEQFTQPGYFPELVTEQPCFLIGGRGTGKTTTLKSLSYKGRFALGNDQPKRLDQWGYVGIYLRINTGRVAAFQGPEASLPQWERIFGHYLNLLLSSAALDFFEWYSRTHREFEQLSAQSLGSFSNSFSMPEATSVADAIEKLKQRLITLETTVNSIGRSNSIDLTALGAPIDALMDCLQASGILGKTTFFFLIDEFENLSAYQQRVVNTLIKHARPPYTFKIGVRELGIRERCTLNASELLVDPADFRRIDIAERLTSDSDFENFAALVCARRIRSHGGTGVVSPGALIGIFQSLSPEEEADLLGLSKTFDSTNQIILLTLSGKARARYESMSQLERYCLYVLEGSSIDSLQSAMTSEDFKAWKTRFENYKTSMLFTIKSRKSGIRKYYCGWKVICKLASGNIRYLLELVHRSIQMQLDASNSSSFQGLVSAEVQTRAAQYIGRKNLRELEGLSILGARVAKLVLSLGRIFQVMAEDPVGHTAEITQFDLVSNDDLGSSAITRELLENAVMHLALIRRAGTKLQQSEDVRDYDYALHPIFTAFFEYSYRHKRKMTLSYEELRGLSENPHMYIARVLKRQNRSADSTLPAQMALFQDFYRGSH